MPKRDDCRLRPMAEGDLRKVLEWRNDERIRHAMYTDHVISWDEHRAWFERINKEKTSLHFIFEVSGRPLGVVNVTQLDRVNGKCVWGFYIGADDAPRGSGSAMGWLAIEHIIENLNFRKIIGEALADNEESIKYHLRLGFDEEGRLKEHVLKNGEYVDIVTFGLLDRRWRSIRDGLAERFFRGSSA
jgi:UDP-4-amino-4,6-dideoxy-N-acetyl-beta-L-altrosamine N-acetyltransferase